MHASFGFGFGGGDCVGRVGQYTTAHVRATRPSSGHLPQLFTGSEAEAALWQSVASSMCVLWMTCLFVCFVLL